MTTHELIHSLSDKQTVHSYLPFYQGLMSSSRTRDCVVVEVGVYSGGSLLLWRDLLPRSRIIGIDTNDIVDKRVPLLKGETEVLIGDAYSEAMIRMLPTEVDFAIDDGPHTLESQLKFIDLYLPLLKPGGVAVIEDIQNPEWIEALATRVPMGYQVSVVDLRFIKGRYDDMLLVIER